MNLRISCSDSSIPKEYFLVLREKRWHCRVCAGIQIESTYDENRPIDCPTKGLVEAEHGCYGCGWCDFNAWRVDLNQ